MAKEIKKYSKIALIFSLWILMVGMYTIIPIVHGAYCSKEKDVLTDSRPSTVSDHEIYFVTPTGVGTSTDTIIISFDGSNDGFDLSSIVLADIDLAVDDDNNCDGGWTQKTLADTATSSVWGVSVSTSTDQITFTPPTNATTGEIAADRCVQIEIGTNAGGSNQITNPAAGGCEGASSVCDIDISGAFGDTGKTKVAIIAGIAVSATVSETLTFTATDSAIGFGTLDASEVRYATANEQGATSTPAAGQPTQLSLTTNASGGATITIKDVGNGTDAAGLYKSTATVKLIPAVASSLVSTSTEEYGVYGKDASSLTIHEGFDDDTVSDVAISRTPQTFATAAVAVSGGTVDVSMKACIAGTTPAGSYADTVIVIATPTY